MRSRNASPLARTGLARDALAGKVAIITGAGAGVGREIALACAWLGAKVVVADLSESGLDTAEDIVSWGGEALFVRSDVTDEGFVAHLLATTQACFGPPDILVNNASLVVPAALSELSPTLFDRMLAVNLRAPFLTCRAVLPAMLARGDGLIVNLVATDDLPGLATYAATKQGLVGLTRSLAGEVGSRGVRVVALALEPTDTPGQRANANMLAPRLGLTPEQFLSVSLHPAYDGPMPAADAGAAAAYLIAGGGAGYHGALVSVYTLLERAGLIAVPLESHEAEVDGYDQPTGSRLARALSAQLQAEISATSAEFSLLPIFARSLVHNHLRIQTGQSLQDWDATIADLERQLARLETTQDPMVSFALQARRDYLREGLALLQHYYARVPEETARYSSDQRFLRQIQQLAERRVKLIDDLIHALERV